MLQQQYIYIYISLRAACSALSNGSAVSSRLLEIVHQGGIFTDGSRFTHKMNLKKNHKAIEKLRVFFVQMNVVWMVHMIEL